MLRQLPQLITLLGVSAPPGAWRFLLLPVQHPPPLSYKMHRHDNCLLTPRRWWRLTIAWLSLQCFGGGACCLLAMLAVIARIRMVEVDLLLFALLLVCSSILCKHLQDDGSQLRANILGSVSYFYRQIHLSWLHHTCPVVHYIYIYIFLDVCVCFCKTSLYVRVYIVKHCVATVNRCFVLPHCLHLGAGICFAQPYEIVCFYLNMPWWLGKYAYSSMCYCSLFHMNSSP